MEAKIPNTVDQPRARSDHVGVGIDGPHFRALGNGTTGHNLLGQLGRPAEPELSRRDDAHACRC